MQLSLTDRPRGPLWLAAVLVALGSGALWWPPSGDGAAAPAPAAVPAAVIPERVSLPAAGSTAAAPVAATSAPAFRFVGTVVAGAGSFATVQRTADAQLLELRVGDRVDGLAVTAIEPGRVVLAGAAQPVVIEAGVAAAEPGPPAASAAANAASAAKVEQPAWAEGEAPWDLAPPFRH